MVDQAGQAVEAAWLARLGRTSLTVDIYANRHRTAFDAAHNRSPDGWNLHNRVFPYHLFYYIFRNTVRWRILDQEGVLRPSSFIWLAPNIQHSFSFDPVNHVQLIHIVLQMGPIDQIPSPPLTHLILPHAPQLETPMRLLHNALDDQGPHAQACVRAALTLVCARALAGRAASAVRHRLDLTQCRVLETFLHHRRLHELRPADLARALGFSHDYFTRLFRATYGVSPRAWLNRERIARAAADLINTRLSIATLSARHEYPDVFAFSKQFTKTIGMSPTRYRALTRG
jgi:AraC-like DNA-binding protein